jgi:hypothetical protein
MLNSIPITTFDITCKVVYFTYGFLLLLLLLLLLPSSSYIKFACNRILGKSLLLRHFQTFRCSSRRRGAFRVNRKYGLATLNPLCAYAPPPRVYRVGSSVSTPRVLSRVGVVGKKIVRFILALRNSYGTTTRRGARRTMPRANTLRCFCLFVCSEKNVYFINRRRSIHCNNMCVCIHFTVI